VTTTNGLTRIALVGDYRPDVTAHVCAPRALHLAASDAGVTLASSWIETNTLAKHGVAETLKDFDGVWCVPNSPYEHQGAVLDAIHYARTNDVPYLGTCGGFQHAVIEFARNELNLETANSVEDEPGTGCPVIVELACSLREVAGDIRLTPGSKLATIYDQIAIKETYNCGYGFNPAVEEQFSNSSMVICGRDDEPKAVEISDHRFFVATAFQPERSALNDMPHPVVSAFVNSATE